MLVYSFVGSDGGKKSVLVVVFLEDKSIKNFRYLQPEKIIFQHTNK